MKGHRPSSVAGLPVVTVEPAAAFARRVHPVIRMLQLQGLTAHGIARALSARGVRTRQGCCRWSGTQIKQILARMEK